MPTQTVSGRQVIINVPQTACLLLENGKLTRHVFPVLRWVIADQNPLGEYKVTDSTAYPTWFVPAIRTKCASPAKM